MDFGRFDERASRRILSSVRDELVEDFEKSPSIIVGAFDFGDREQNGDFVRGEFDRAIGPGAGSGLSGSDARVRAGCGVTPIYWSRYGAGRIHRLDMDSVFPALLGRP